MHMRSSGGPAGLFSRVGRQPCRQAVATVERSPCRTPIWRPFLLAITPLGLLFSGPAVAGEPGEPLPEPVAAAADVAHGEGGTAEPSEPAEGNAAEPAADEGEEAAAAAADESVVPGEITGEATLVSDYIFRGITNSDHNPAIQGGLSYSVDVGLPGAKPYIGFWGSNVDFDDGGEATVEIDAQFGFSGTIGTVDWDLGALYYAYPGARSDLNYDYWEVPLQLSYALNEHLSFQGQYAYSPDFFAGSGQAHYLMGGARWQQPIWSMTLSAEATTGHQWIEHNGIYGTDDYQDWRIAVSLAIDKITLGIAYTDTDLDRSECFGGTNQCGPRVTFSVGASF